MAVLLRVSLLFVISLCVAALNNPFELTKIDVKTKILATPLGKFSKGSSAFTPNAGSLATPSISPLVSSGGINNTINATVQPTPKSPDESPASSGSDAVAELRNLLDERGCEECPAGLSFPDMRNCLKGGGAFPSAAHCMLSHMRDSRSSDTINCTAHTGFSDNMVRMIAQFRNLAMSRRAAPLLLNGTDLAATDVLRIYNHNHWEGLGDHIMGYSHAIVMGLLSPSAQAVVIDDLPYEQPYNVPLTLTWAPCPGSDGYNWTMPSYWQTALAPGSILAKSGTPIAAISHATGDVRHNNVAGFNTTHRTYLVRNGGDNATLVRWFTRDIMGATGAYVKTFVWNERPMRMNRSDLFPRDAGAWYKRRSTTAPELPPEATNMIAGNDVISLRESIELFDYFFWPSTALLRRIISVSGLHGASDQYVISFHLRIGSPAAGASYQDPARDPLDRSVAAALMCGYRAMDDLIAKHGKRRQFLWYLASDRPDALGALRAELRNSTRLRGGRVSVQIVDLGLSSVMHTGKSVLAREEARRGYLDTFTDHAMLSGAHAMVRSWSGYSYTAQLWGRVGQVYRVSTAGGPSCQDASDGSK